MKALKGGGAEGDVHAREVYWIAPEVFRFGYDELSEKSDVFSYGTLLITNQPNVGRTAF